MKRFAFLYRGNERNTGLLIIEFNFAILHEIAFHLIQRQIEAFFGKLVKALNSLYGLYVNYTATIPSPHGFEKLPLLTNVSSPSSHS